MHIHKPFFYKQGDNERFPSSLGTEGWVTDSIWRSSVSPGTGGVPHTLPWGKVVFAVFCILALSHWMAQGRNLILFTKKLKFPFLSFFPRKTQQVSYLNNSPQLARDWLQRCALPQRTLLSSYPQSPTVRLFVGPTSWQGGRGNSPGRAETSAI